MTGCETGITLYSTFLPHNNLISTPPPPTSVQPNSLLHSPPSWSPECPAPPGEQLAPTKQKTRRCGKGRKIHLFYMKPQTVSYELANNWFIISLILFLDHLTLQETKNTKTMRDYLSFSVKWMEVSGESQSEQGLNSHFIALCIRDDLLMRHNTVITV